MLKIVTSLIILFFFIFIILGIVFNVPDKVNKEKIEKLQNSQCIDNLRNVYAGLLQYRLDFGDFPDGITAFNHLGNRKDLVCPLSPEKSNSYIYIYPIYSQSKYDIKPLIRDMENNHHGTINVLMSDSGVLTIPHNSLDDSIIEYNKQSKHNIRPYQQ